MKRFISTKLLPTVLVLLLAASLIAVAAGCNGEADNTGRHT